MRRSIAAPAGSLAGARTGRGGGGGKVREEGLERGARLLNAAGRARGQDKPLETAPAGRDGRGKLPNTD